LIIWYSAASSSSPGLRSIGVVFSLIPFSDSGGRSANYDYRLNLLQSSPWPTCPAFVVNATHSAPYVFPS
jgi:hypothetical protein